MVSLGKKRVLLPHQLGTVAPCGQALSDCCSLMTLSSFFGQRMIKDVSCIRIGRCSAGAIIIAGAIALALLDGPIETAQFLSQLGEWAQTIEHSVADSIQQLIEWIHLPPDEAVIPISKAGLAPAYSDRWYADAWQGISPFVTPSILWSL